MRLLIVLGQLILALGVILFLMYKLALALDMVPEDFSPKGMANTEYQMFKNQLKAASTDDDLQSKLAKIVLFMANKTEAYFTDNQYDARQKALADQCQETSIMRFFMFMGADNKESKGCMQNNIQLEHEVKKYTPTPVSKDNKPVSIQPTVKEPQPVNNTGAADLSGQQNMQQQQNVQQQQTIINPPPTDLPADLPTTQPTQ